eukprot:s734_g12.t1
MFRGVAAKAHDHFLILMTFLVTICCIHRTLLTDQQGLRGVEQFCFQEAGVSLASDRYSCLPDVKPLPMRKLISLQRLVVLFSPRYPVLSPLLFCLLAVATVRGLFLTGLKATGTANQSRRSRVGNSSLGRSTTRSWTEELKASGKHFHAKSACLEVLQLLNQIVGLRRLLHLGQANLWICSYAILWLSFEAVDFRMSSKGSVLVAVRILSGFWVY